MRYGRRGGKNTGAILSLPEAVAARRAKAKTRCINNSEKLEGGENRKYGGDADI